MVNSLKNVNQKQSLLFRFIKVLPFSYSIDDLKKKKLIRVLSVDQVKFLKELFSK